MSKRAQVQALLQLCRIPNVFTAMANVVAGLVLARGGAPECGDYRVVGASALLYLAGMVLNDFFDRAVDAIERPHRPIPSGRIPASLALGFGLALMVGAGALLWPMGEEVQMIGVGLALAILAYDGGLKSTPLGAASMGLCRSLNVLLGFAVVPWPSAWMWVLPVAMGFYTAVITYLARDEVVGLGLDRSRATTRMMSTLFLSLVIFVTLLTPAQEIANFVFVGPFFMLLGVRGAKLFGPLMQDASPPVVGRAIGGGILLMPAIDASVVASAGHYAWALAVLAFTLPALVLKRWYYLT